MSRKFRALLIAEFWGGSLMISIAIGAMRGWASGMMTFGIIVLLAGLAGAWASAQGSARND